MELQEFINKAREAKRNGNLMVALDYYNEAFDMLIREATQHARKQEGAFIDEGDTRKIMPKMFEENKKYLKKDKTAAVISNNMGVIFAELKDYEGAEKFFNQAIELTPDGIEYKDPEKNLEELKKE